MIKIKNNHAEIMIIYAMKLLCDGIIPEKYVVKLETNSPSNNFPKMVKRVTHGLKPGVKIKLFKLL
jgi:hypothetical protein